MKKIDITILDIDSDVYFFDVQVDKILMNVMCNLSLKEGELILGEIGIEGPGAGSFPRNMPFKTIIKEFGKLFNAHTVIAIGGTRTTGRMKGTSPSPIVVKI